MSNSNTDTPTHTSTPTSLAHDTHKVLGLAWCSGSDNLMYQLKIEQVSRPLTKRKILSLASAIFDPLGLLNPTLVIAKLIIKNYGTINSNGISVYQPILQMNGKTFIKDCLR